MYEILPSTSQVNACVCVCVCVNAHLRVCLYICMMYCTHVRKHFLWVCQSHSRVPSLSPSTPHTHIRTFSFLLLSPLLCLSQSRCEFMGAHTHKTTTDKVRNKKDPRREKRTSSSASNDSRARTHTLAHTRTHTHAPTHAQSRTSTHVHHSHAEHPHTDHAHINKTSSAGVLRTGS